MNFELQNCMGIARTTYIFFNELAMAYNYDNTKFESILNIHVVDLQWLASLQMLFVTYAKYYHTLISQYYIIETTHYYTRGFLYNVRLVIIIEANNIIL